METSHAARVLSLCMWLIFKGKVASPVAELSAARGNRSPSPACVLALPPRDKRKGRDGEKVPPVSHRQALLGAPGLEGEGLWDGGAGIADVGGGGSKSIKIRASSYKGMSRALSGALLSRILSPTREHIAEWPEGAGETPST